MIAINQELISNLIYLVSNYRYFEKEWELDKTWENESVMLKYRADLDDFLGKHGFKEFISRDALAEELVFIRQLKGAI